MTLAAFDEAGSMAALADPSTPQEVLKYFLTEGSRRSQLLSAVFNNPSAPEESVARIAENATGEVINALLSTPRLMESTAILAPLLHNPNLSAEQHAVVDRKLPQPPPVIVKASTTPGPKFVEDPVLKGILLELSLIPPVKGTKPVPLSLAGMPEFAPKALDAYKADYESITDTELLEWLKEHEAELEAEQRDEKPFTLLGGVDELGGEDPAEITAEALQAAKGNSTSEDERVSTLQKLARLNVAERIKVAMLGTKEERGILIRDGSKLVSSAVLTSPKVSEQEIEAFANMKNVRENVLRDIGRNHRFKKNYVVVKNLCANPRTPLDVSLSLIKNLIGPDLKTLSMNKNVPETLRKMAQKLFNVRTNPGRG